MTESDVENYKQIKTDLDELRNLVEKSELWVYKVKHDDSKKKHKSSTEDKVRDAGSSTMTARGSTKAAQRIR